MKSSFDQEIKIKNNTPENSFKNDNNAVKKFKSLWSYFESTLFRQNGTGKSFKKQLSLYAESISEGINEVNTTFNYLKFYLLPFRQNTPLFERLGFDRTTRNVISRDFSNKSILHKEKIKIIFLVANQIYLELSKKSELQKIEEYLEIIRLINQFLIKVLDQKT